MKIATQTSYLGQLLGDVEAIKLLARVGYGGIDYSMFYMNDINCPLHGNDYMDHVKKVKSTAEERGIPFTQGHAFFPFYKENEDDFNKEAYQYTLRSIEIASYLGIDTLTMHPVVFENDIEEKNIELFSSLVPYLNDYNVNIAIENIFGPNKMNICSDPKSHGKLIDRLNEIENRFVALVDVGHAEYGGYKADEFIRGLGHDRLKGLHIQDSDRIKDLHQLPFLHKFDWEAITKALADIDYTGDFTFEADKFLRLFPAEMVEDASFFMLKVGEQLVRMIERQKNKKSCGISTAN